MNLSQAVQIAISVAVNEAARLGHEFVGLEHLLLALLQEKATKKLLRQLCSEHDAGALKRRLEDFLAHSLEAVPEGKRHLPQPTLALQRVLARAESRMQQAGRRTVTGPDVLLAIFGETEAWATRFLNEYGLIMAGVQNAINGRQAAPPPPPPQVSRGDGDDDDDDDDDDGETVNDNNDTRPALVRFAANLNELARNDKLDRLVGRERELERAIHVLCRRRKNNPIFVGESGVGKTAIVEGLAQRIEAGLVPKALRRSVIYSLNVGTLMAGTRYRGDLEKRMVDVLAELAARPGSILFIDELHEVVGTGAAGGTPFDISGMLKPALARGGFRCIGSTTYQEYRTNIGKDRAFARRFQKIDVDEPSVEDTIKILKGLVSDYESTHGVRYTEGAIRRAAELAGRYLQDLKLPDKAVDVFDEAGAAAKLGKRKRVTSREVEKVIAQMAQVPIGSVRQSDKDRLRALGGALKDTVFGQDDAVDTLTTAIRVARAGMSGKDKPVGCFLLMGPTGVGKTELARQVALALGLELIRFDMSEYMERHTVSRLIGAPPGYIGSDRGGLLTDAIRKKPHAVLLLDEIEKAHSDVFNLLLQVMDHGTLTDNDGLQADFRHVILLMTSNVGARHMLPGHENEDEIEKDFRKVFSPEFRNRLDGSLRFRHLSSDVMASVVDKFVGELSDQLSERKVKVLLTPEARELLAAKGYSPEFGARPLARVIHSELKQPIAESILFGALAQGGTATVGAAAGEVTVTFSGACKPAARQYQQPEQIRAQA